MPISTHQNPAGRDLAIEFNLIENSFEGLERFKAELILINNSTQALTGNWSVHFNFLRMILPESVGSGFRIWHVNGDFFCLEPATPNVVLAPHTRVCIPFVANHWAIKAIDAPAGFYIVYRDSDGREQAPERFGALHIRPFVRPEQVMRSTQDRLPAPTAQSRFEQFGRTYLLPKEKLPPVLPTPAFLENGNGVFLLTPSSRIACMPGIKAEAQYLADLMGDWLGNPLVVAEGREGNIRLEIRPVTLEGVSEKSEQEAYSLKIHAGGIDLAGSTAAGIFYGIQTLRLLLPPPAGKTTAITAPFVDIIDAPAFAYRGLHLDVGRNFQPVECIRKLLDLMALYKLNKFHFHLTDDEGWRIEIPGLPELTDIGARRGHTYTETECLLPSYGSGPDPNDPTSAGNGFYSRLEFIELLRYAQARHIEVIPAIDLPGHARAAVRAMEVRYDRYCALGAYDQAGEYLLTDWDDASRYESVQMWRRNVVNIGLESTYRFVEKVVDELQSAYVEAGVSLTAVHIGGDEVPHGAWTESPACRRLMETQPELKNVQDLADYFLKRINHILETRGLLTAGWEEIALIHKDGIRKPNPVFSEHGFMPYVWNTIWGGGGEEIVYALANAGYKVVMANATSLYFDFAYDKDPEEAGYYWGGYVDTETTFRFLPFDLYDSAERDLFGNPIDAATRYKDALRLTEKGRQNILGIQGQLWGETIRTPERIEYLLFPRMLALAERAWAKTPAWAGQESGPVRQAIYAKNWNEFANRLGQLELPRLDAMFGGVRYRIPLPGAVVKDGILSANSEFPGFSIRYTVDGTEPTPFSTLYEKPVFVGEAAVKLKTFAQNGRGSRETEARDSDVKI